MPYIFWVVLWSLIGLLLMKVFGKETFPILQEKLGDWPENILGGVYYHPLPFQFWYIMDLLKISLLSPLIYLLVVSMKGFAVVLFLVLWMLDVSVPHLTSMEVPLFFTLGTFLATDGVRCGLLSESRPRPRKEWLTVPFCWIVFCAAYTLMSALASTHPMPDHVLFIMSRLCTLLGVCSVFILVDFVCGQAPKQAGLKIPDSTFLLFALHEPLQHMIFQRILSSGGSHALHLLLYFGLPVIIILLVCGISRILQRAAPRFWAFLTGGR